MTALAQTGADMNVAVARSDLGDVAGALAGVSARLPGDGKVKDIRKHAFDAFETAGIPHRRIEDWKYTDLRTLMPSVAPLADAPDQAAIGRAEAAIAARAVDGFRKLVLVDGAFVPQLSDLGKLEAGLTIRALRDVLDDAGAPHDTLLDTSAMSNAMSDLNTALMTDGVVIDVAANAELTEGLHILHVATGAGAAAIVTRSQLRLGRHAKAMLVESFYAAEGAGAYQNHDAVMLTVGEGAQLEHIRFMDDGREAVNITSGYVTLGRNARLNTFNLTTGASVSRYQLAITFADQGGELTTNGVNLLKGRQHGDTTFTVDHAVPHCTSRETFRAVLDGQSRSVFQGCIVVRPDAQKTDGKMMSRTILLSDEAVVDNKPELEIFADDVTCGHGATIGALDEALLFYLRARGLPEKEAQAVLIQAFVGEMIETIADERLRDIAIAETERWLAARG